MLNPSSVIKQTSGCQNCDDTWLTTDEGLNISTFILHVCLFVLFFYMFLYNIFIIIFCNAMHTFSLQLPVISTIIFLLHFILHFSMLELVEIQTDLRVCGLMFVCVLMQCLCVCAC